MNSNFYKNAMNKVKPDEELKRDTIRKATKSKHKNYLILKLVSSVCVFIFVVCDCGFVLLT